MDAGLAKPKKSPWIRLAALGLAGALLLPGCQPGYYAQLLRGHYDLLSKREPIEWLLQKPDLDTQLRVRLERALDARRFASKQLLLPDNRSYTLYADLHRPAALWNVFAAPEFSLAPHEWCYWVTGCLAYRGYYQQEDARDEAADLHGQGFDVSIGPVPAYSTLGWFDDPVVSTVLTTDDTIAGTIFHELAHQKAFVRGDTAFDESFATFVEQQGLREYFRATPDIAQRAAQRMRRQDQFVEMVLATRKRLEALYASGLAEARMREKKAAEFDRMRHEYATLKQRWGGYAGYDDWMAGELNNARILPFGLYHQWVPAFEALFARARGDWTAFYASVGQLASLDAAGREREMESLRMAASEAAGPG